MKDQPFKKTRFTFVKRWHQFLDFISDGRIPTKSKEYMRRYAAYKRKNLRL